MKNIAFVGAMTVVCAALSVGFIRIEKDTAGTRRYYVNLSGSVILAE